MTERNPLGLTYDLRAIKSICPNKTLYGYTCVLTHKLIFEKDFLGAFASNKAENVDRLGDMNTLLSKVEMTIRRLPVWMHSIDLERDRNWDGLEKTSQELCANKRAKAWLLLKWRIKNTYEHLEGIKEHPVEDLISIPDELQLITDLSKPTVKYRGSKLLIESKQDMHDRSISSPDYGDSLAYCF